MNLPNPTQGMSTEAQLLGDLIEQTKQQGVYQEVQLKTDQYSQKPGGVAFKRSEKTSKKPLEKIQADDKTGLSGVNAKLTQGGPISKALMVQADQEKAERKIQLEQAQETNTTFREGGKFQQVQEKIGEKTSELFVSGLQKTTDALTHGTKTGMAQFNKGISELTNGLGELGPAVTMVQTAFNKVRAVFDLFIGTFRFLTELPGMFTKFMGKKDEIVDEDSLKEAAEGGLEATKDNLEGLGIDIADGEGSGVSYPALRKTIVAALIDYDDLKEAGMPSLRGSVREGLGKVAGDRGVKGDDGFMSFDYDLSNDDDGESASEKAKQRLRERAEDKLRKEQLKETKKGNVDRKKTGKKSVGLLGRIGGAAFSIIALIALAIAAIKSLKFGFQNIFNTGSDNVNALTGLTTGITGGVSGFISGITRGGTNLRTLSRPGTNVGLRTSTTSPTGFRNSAGQFARVSRGSRALAYGATGLRALPFVAGAVDAGLDLKGQMDNRAALEEAYNNQIPLPLDGPGAPDRPLTQEEYETLVKADRANKAGSVGKGVGGVAGGFAGAATGAKIGGFFGSFLGPVGTAIGAAGGAIVGGVIGAFAGGRAGDAAATETAEAIQGIQELDSQDLMNRINAEVQATKIEDVANVGDLTAEVNETKEVLGDNSRKNTFYNADSSVNNSNNTENIYGLNDDFEDTRLFKYNRVGYGYSLG